MILSQVSASRGCSRRRHPDLHAARRRRACDHGGPCPARRASPQRRDQYLGTAGRDPVRHHAVAAARPDDEQFGQHTYAAVDRNLHVFATDLILLDRSLRPLGPSADEPRKRLLAYVEQALKDAPISRANEVSEHLLDDVGNSLRELKFNDEQKIALWNDARSVYRQAVQQRWTFVEQSDGSFPSPLICILVGWLTLMFATLGFRAPRNAVVVSTYVAAAALIAAAIYLILEMSTPFSGPIQLSDRPLVRAAEEIRR
ncbi:bestrophin-like domain [Bradyrhizobium embrapense]